MMYVTNSNTFTTCLVLVLEHVGNFGSDCRLFAMASVASVYIVYIVCVVVVVELMLNVLRCHLTH